MKRIFITILAVSLLASPFSAAPALAAPQKFVDLTESSNNFKFRSPRMSVGAWSKGVIDTQTDTDWRQMKVTKNGIGRFSLKATAGQVTAVLYKNSESQPIKTVTVRSGNTVILGTSVAKGDTLYLKLTGTKDSAYDIWSINK